MSKEKKGFLSAVTEALQSFSDEVTQWTMKKDKSKADTATVDNRIHARIVAEFEVIIYCNNRSFRTRTANISRSGLLLKESLPVEFCVKNVDLIIYYDDPSTQKKMRLPLKASVIGAPLISSRLSFVPIANGDKVRKDYDYFFDQIVEPPLRT